MGRHLFRTSFVALAMLTLAACDQQQTSPAEDAVSDAEDPIVVTVNGTALRQSDLIQLLESMPPEMRQMPPAFMYDQMVTQLVNRHLLIKAALAAGYEDNADVLERLEDLKGDILREAWLFDEIDKRITDDRLQAAYEERYADFEGEAERHARHILVDTEEQAQDLIDQINEGGDFIALANEHSTDKVSVDGDLGYFAPSVMVAPFAEAAFALEVGAMSQEPVQTQFGWHVILVEDERAAQAPSFEEVEAELRQTETRKAYTDIIAELREKAVIEIPDDPTLEEPAPIVPVVDEPEMEEPAADEAPAEEQQSEDPSEDTED